mmetsp:Transcript_88219/g.234244  ORF Transcript_88219/g.234244 Transcript_88219/m.234244 type:complete len:310 (+) Transcript_88219:476-1405(+)
MRRLQLEGSSDVLARLGQVTQLPVSGGSNGLRISVCGVQLDGPERIALRREQGQTLDSRDSRRKLLLVQHSGLCQANECEHLLPVHSLSLDVAGLEPPPGAREAAHRAGRAPLHRGGVVLDGLLNADLRPLQLIESLQPAGGLLGCAQEVLAGHALGEDAPHARPARVSRPPARFPPGDELNLHGDLPAGSALRHGTLLELQDRGAARAQAAHSKVHARGSLALAADETLRIRRLVLDIPELHVRILDVEEDAGQLVSPLGNQLPDLLGAALDLLARVSLLQEPVVGTAHSQVCGRRAVLTLLHNLEEH